jgi:prolipoprotein diacylglyceryl transferase
MFIPAPPFSEFHIGPVPIHLYAICLIVGIVVAWIWAGNRAESWGANRDDFETIALVMVVTGFIGARIYHVVTEHDLYFGNGQPFWHVFAIWNGGIGIIGGIAGGAIGAYVMCRVKKMSFASFADAIAPTILVAQALGRVGNWFNQEAFGKPSTLPWALYVDYDHRPCTSTGSYNSDGCFKQYDTFHPTFLYEGLWNVLGVGVLLLLERKLRFGKGKLALAYVMWYTFGRFWIEQIRIDPVNIIWGLRVNSWFDAAAFVASAVLLMVFTRKFPGRDEFPFRRATAEGSGPVDGNAQTAEPAADQAVSESSVDTPVSGDGTGGLAQPDDGSPDSPQTEAEHSAN